MLSTLATAADAPAAPDDWPIEARRDIKWLNISGQTPVPALLRHSESVNITGNAILIPEAGKQVVSPYQMMYLRRSLAELGWNTLLIEPPPWPDTDQPQFWNEHRRQLTVRIKAALELTETLRGRTLFIAEGLSASSTMKIFSDGALAQPEALVLLSPYVPDVALNQEIIGWFGQSGYPLMDFYTSFDNRWAQSTVTQRATAARKQVRLDFRQVNLAVPPPNDSAQRWLTRQIHGWIDHLGW
ncbi:alpha/beta hydrolase family protein [Neiella marina]|uniref:Alpha/beta hydrolase family protein n=1 Tax=Neiella holothuriorum TaxID=2870530 RepID=A0ABS7EIX9_9GAMM|nr:DUF3530 family protein [Neiella holothuriorum]MBW8192303.1 alpha/beta hydrolase family protein [Neiella holothuriorum]